MISAYGPEGSPYGASVVVEDDSAEGSGGAVGDSEGAVDDSGGVVGNSGGAVGSVGVALDSLLQAVIVNKWQPRITSMPIRLKVIRIVLPQKKCLYNLRRKILENVTPYFQTI